jgi:putative addiction module component (TIGR02574 family)
MSSLIHELGLDRLSAADRLVLVHELWDSLSSNSNESLATESQRAELRERLAEDDATPDDVVSWDEVKRLTARHLQQ